MGLWKRLISPHGSRRKKAWEEPLTTPPPGSLPLLLDDKLLIRNATVRLVVPSTVVSSAPSVQNNSFLTIARANTTNSDEESLDAGHSYSQHGIPSREVKEAGYGTLLSIKGGGTVFTSPGGRVVMELRKSGADVDMLPPRREGAAIGETLPVARLRHVGSEISNRLGVGAKVAITIPAAPGMPEDIAAPPFAVATGCDIKGRYLLYLGDGDSSEGGIAGALTSPRAAASPSISGPIARFARRKLGERKHVWEVEGVAGVNMGLLLAVTASLDGVLSAMPNHQQQRHAQYAVATRPVVTSMTNVSEASGEERVSGGEPLSMGVLQMPRGQSVV